MLSGEGMVHRKTVKNNNRLGQIAKATLHVQHMHCFVHFFAVVLHNATTT